jgi:hypothetical protein
LDRIAPTCLLAVFGLMNRAIPEAKRASGGLWSEVLHMREFMGVGKLPGSDMIAGVDSDYRPTVIEAKAPGDALVHREVENRHSLPL